MSYLCKDDAELNETRDAMIIKDAMVGILGKFDGSDCNQSEYIKMVSPKLDSFFEKCVDVDLIKSWDLEMSRIKEDNILIKLSVVSKNNFQWQIEMKIAKKEDE